MEFIIALLFFVIVAIPMLAGYTLYKRNKAKKEKENTTYVPYREVSHTFPPVGVVARADSRKVGPISRKYPGWRRPTRSFKTPISVKEQNSVERSSNFGDGLLGSAGYALGSSGRNDSDSSPSSSEPSFSGGGGSFDGGGASSSWGDSSGSSSSSSSDSSSSSNDSESSGGDSGGGSSE